MISRCPVSQAMNYLYEIASRARYLASLDLQGGATSTMIDFTETQETLELYSTYYTYRDGVSLDSLSSVAHLTVSPDILRIIPKDVFPTLRSIFIKDCSVDWETTFQSLSMASNAAPSIFGSFANNPLMAMTNSSPRLGHGPPNFSLRILRLQLESEQLEQFFIRAPSFPSLERLEIRREGFSTVTEQVVRNPLNLPSLRYLTVECLSFTEIKALSLFCNVPRFERLVLDIYIPYHQTQVTLPKLFRLPPSRELELHIPPTKGIQVLLKVLQVEQVEKLHLNPSPSPILWKLRCSSSMTIHIQVPASTAWPTSSSSYIPA